MTSYTYNSYTDALTSVTQGESTVSYTYAADRLSTISTESSTYTFTYDEAGNTKQIKVGDRTLVTNTYDLSRGLLWYSVYGNGSRRNYTYDSLGRVIAETNDDYPIEPAYEYFYDNAGNLALVWDHDRGTETRYVYDLADRLVRVEDSAGLTVTYEYDNAGRQHKLSYTVGGETVTQEMTYGEGALADRPSGLKINDVPIKSYTYDSLNRVTKTTLNTTAPVETNYTYLNHPTTANQTSSVVAGVKVGANAQYTYSYDQNGNIIRENKGGYTKYSYSYDEKGQLTGFSDADVYYDDAPSEYWYEYDDAGNLTDVYFGNSQDEERVAQYQYTDSSWGDLLTSFNGQAITYDAIGNPLNYYDGNIFTWKNGRQLVSWEHGSGVTYGSLEYDTEGYRASKTTENGETSYLYSGGSLLRETKTNPTTNATVYDLYFTYDEAGRPFSISSYSEALYYFYDIYGNVKYLYDAHGNLVAEYTYRDPWGGDVELTCHYFEGFWIAELNPFTYKGYYYDADLQMYYCGSRYYDPETCRWINADGYVSTGQGIVGNNMYAYCGNNPVMYLDLSGTRYCAAGSVKAETAAERKVSCEHTKNALVESSQTDYPTINPNQPNNTTEADMTPMEKWKKEGVEFKPNTNGEGGKLINSYKITDYFEMYEYASYLMNESEYAGNFEGSVVGFVYEWEVHNIAYDFYTFIGDYESVARAKDLDVGRTIFSDNHIPLGSIMQASYWLIQPSYAMSDFLIHSLG